jgi:hypothetical protein
VQPFSLFNISQPYIEQFHPGGGRDSYSDPKGIKIQKPNFPALKRKNRFLFIFQVFLLMNVPLIFSLVGRSGINLYENPDFSGRVLIIFI